MMSNRQLSGYMLSLLWSVGALAGLLPDSQSNGYQYNRPSLGIQSDPDRRIAYDASGRLLSRGNPFVQVSPVSARPGFPGRFSPGVIGYNSGRTNVAYRDGYNGAFPGGVSLPPAAYQAIPEAYRTLYNGDNGRGQQQPPRPYSFQYEVVDPPSGNDYGQRESSDGNVVTGEYRVLLPDSRTQIVKYTADDVNGYNADVQYEGQVQYPRPSAAYQFAGPAAALASYQQPGFGFSPYQGRGKYARPGVTSLVSGFGANGNGIFGSSGGGVGVGASPTNQYLPPGGGYGK